MKKYEARMEKEMAIKDAVSSITGEHSANLSLNKLFDPIQTHSLSSINKNKLPEVKAELRKLGCNKFRLVKIRNVKNQVILCFNDNGYLEIK